VSASDATPADHGAHPGLGLSTGREAARHIGGELSIDASQHGASFGLDLRGGPV
jgi:C4-dicarboxylate-specific signal transduction histidine kinase